MGAGELMPYRKTYHAKLGPVDYSSTIGIAGFDPGAGDDHAVLVVPWTRGGKLSKMKAELDRWKKANPNGRVVMMAREERKR